MRSAGLIELLVREVNVGECHAQVEVSFGHTAQADPAGEGGDQMEER